MQRSFLLLLLSATAAPAAAAADVSPLFRRNVSMVHGNATAFGNASLAGLPTGSCDANTPCANGACCGKSNFCGYSPRFCGAGCQHNCDAKAECGPYAPADSQTCPLNVCCSAFGFCGSTSEFCTWTSRDDPAYAQCDTRYGGCGSVTRPSCGGSASSSAAARRIGYYESWANTRTCDAVAPEDLNLVGFTHINFAFAFFDGASFQVTSMDANAAALYSRFTALKSKAPGLQAWVSIGGWSLTDPGPTRTAFSAMVGSAGNRATFIAGVSRFLATYGFDGVDLDWEYPVADDRGGTKADKANYAALAREMKAAFAGRYGISMTLPTSYWYLQHFDLPAIAPHVDWFNLMSYDLHGVWDRDSRFVGPYIAPHTNLTEIDLGLDLLWRSGVAPGQVVLGEGWYGRSFTLADSACTQPNGVCRFSGPAEPGPCSAAAGILDRREIDNIIAANHLQPSWDKSAGVKWITWDNQWVSYDDEDTLQQKHDFASSRCLGGTMVWAMDQISQNGTDGSQNGNQNGAAADAQSVCRFASCDSNSAKCPHGSSTVKGAPGSTCPATGHQKEKERPLCCDGGTTLGKCQWRGYRGAGLACMGACLEGETLVATSGDGRSGTGVTRQTCSGGQQMYCCSGFAAAPKNKKKDDKKKKLEDAAEDAAKGVAEAAAAQVAIDILAKAFCRIAVPALLAPLEALEALIPIVGEILDLVEIAATPALIMACTKAVEKEGKAELKIFGKKHTLSLDRSHEKPPATRPPERSHDKPKTSTRDDGSCAKDGKGTKGGRGGRGGRNRRDEDGHLAPADNCMRHITSYTGHVYETYETRTRICRGDHYPQACMHYESAVYAGGHRFNPLTCDEHVPPRNFVRNPNAATARWAAQHHRGWTEWMRRERRRCQRDEWPPHHFWQGRAGELIRFNHKEDNAGAGQLWNQFCPEFAPHGCRAGSVRVYDPPPYARRPVTTFCEKLVTLQVMSMEFDVDDVPLRMHRTFGLAENECHPYYLVRDPTFALLNEDPTVRGSGSRNVRLWRNPPPAQLVQGRGWPPFPIHRRSDVTPVGVSFDEDLADGFNATDIVVDTGNTTRLLTDEEKQDLEAYMKRSADEAELLRLLLEKRHEMLGPDDTLSAEYAALKQYKYRLTPASALAKPTLVASVATETETGVSRGTRSSSQLLISQPRATAAAETSGGF